MRKTQGMDEYLEAIYVLKTEGHQVIGSKLAKYLGVARPTVSQTMQRLVASGYVEDTDSREISLTEQGIERAETVIRRHRLIERWLTDVLGLDWAEAHEEASRLEHAISDRVEKRLSVVLGHPTTCPHGNLIPGTDAIVAKAIPLSQLNVPSPAEISRIFEYAEEDPEILRFLQANGIVPGARIQLVSSSPENNALTVHIDDHLVQIDLNIADRILVSRLFPQTIIQ